MKRLVKVVILPTEDDSYISIIDNAKGRRLNYFRKELNTSPDRTPQHIYITIPQDVEPIKEGEKGWFYDYNYNTITKVARDINGDNYFRDRDIRKIIATTDPKLKVQCSCEGTGYDGRKRCMECNGIGDIKLPQVQQSFLKEYCTNPDGLWEVEYEKTLERYRVIHNHLELTLKLNQDNTVNITAAEKKMYSREEVDEFLFQLSNCFGWDDKDAEEEIENFHEKLTEIKDSL